MHIKWCEGEEKRCEGEEERSRKAKANFLFFKIKLRINRSHFFFSTDQHTHICTNSAFIVKFPRKTYTQICK